jgi:hypothetical protein
LICNTLNNLTQTLVFDKKNNPTVPSLISGPHLDRVGILYVATKTTKLVNALNPKKS